MPRSIENPAQLLSPPQLKIGWYTLFPGPEGSVQWLAIMKPREPPDFGYTGIPAEQISPVDFEWICTPGYTGFSLSLSPANTNTTVNASNNTAFHVITLLATDFRSWGLGMSRRVGGVINLMYSRYEKFKKWIT